MEFEGKIVLVTGAGDAGGGQGKTFALAPGGKEHWNTFVKRRKDFKAGKMDEPFWYTHEANFFKARR